MALKTNKKILLTDDGERMVPYHHKGKLMYAEHLTRYQAVLSFVSNKVVLDIASGSGYGTKLLSSKAKKVYGVDVSSDAITYAKKQYGAPNISYLLGDGEAIPLADNSVDVVITFETIEHIKDYKKFLDEVDRVLKDGGVAIVSTPNDLEFAEGNHFHLHEFKEDELTTLLSKKYKHIDKYYQATWKAVGIGKPNLFSDEGKLEAAIENLSAIKPEKYLYFFFVCSNTKIKEIIEPKVAIGEHYSDRKLKEISDEIMAGKLLAQDYEQKISELRSEKEDLARTLDKTSKKLKQTTAELEGVYASSSWRLTQPLRKIKRGIAK